jgi:hypothetical protein
MAISPSRCRSAWPPIGKSQVSRLGKPPFQRRGCAAVEIVRLLPRKRLSNEAATREQPVIGSRATAVDQSRVPDEQRSIRENDRIELESAARSSESGLGMVNVAGL